jgi:hypothetical protein
MRTTLPGATLVASFIFLLAATSGSLAQASIEAQCRGASGKTLACCTKIVRANPSIAQCDKEVAVFRCVGAKNNKYVSRNGCVMPGR